MSRPLPTLAESARILAAKRTRYAPRPAPPAGRALSPFIKSLDQKFGRGHDALAARWREIVGEPLYKHTEPVKLTRPRNGDGATLELKVDGPLAALIQHQAPDILARVNLVLGVGAVAKLRIVQGVIRRPAAAHSAASAAMARRKRAQPLDAAVEAELEAGVARAQDERLRLALRKLGREVLRRERESLDR
jgi:hypothetical protein